MAHSIDRNYSASSNLKSQVDRFQLKNLEMHEKFTPHYSGSIKRLQRPKFRPNLSEQSCCRCCMPGKLTLLQLGHSIFSARRILATGRGKFTQNTTGVSNILFVCEIYLVLFTVINNKFTARVIYFLKKARNGKRMSLA